VQLGGQVIQALGGEVVPLTSSVADSNLEGGRTVAKDPEGARQVIAPIEVAHGTLKSTSPGAPGGPAEVVEMNKQLEAAREKASALQKQLDLLRPQLPPAPPTAK
jgi:hypothetical protein